MFIYISFKVAFVPATNIFVLANVSLAHYPNVKYVLIHVYINCFLFVKRKGWINKFLSSDSPEQLNFTHIFYFIHYWIGTKLPDKMNSQNFFFASPELETSQILSTGGLHPALFQVLASHYNKHYSSPSPYLSPGRYPSPSHYPSPGRYPSPGPYPSPSPLSNQLLLKYPSSHCGRL